MTEVFCGIDWAQEHHDLVVVDEKGQLLASHRIDGTASGPGRITRHP